MKHWPFVVFFLVACTGISCEHGGEKLANNAKREDHSNLPEPLGVYQGVVPCGDCEGVETTLTLQDSSEFLLSLIYIGKVTDKVEISGSYSWEESQKQIRLQGFDPDVLPTYYELEENALVQLDLDGSKIDGTLKDRYRLIKAS